MSAGETVLTVEEANLRLPLVRAIVKDAVGLKQDVLARQDRLIELRERYPEKDDEASPYSEEVQDMEKSLHADEQRIAGFATELEDVGAELMNAEQGLVEFDSVLEGRPVRLSWKFDEPEVCFWREEDDEPIDRKPLQLTEAG